MKRILILSALTLASATGLCTMSVSQTSTGPQTGSETANGTTTAGAQPPVVSPIAPDNPVLPLIHGGVKPINGKTKVPLTGNGLLPMTVTFRPWQGLITVYGLANGNNPARFIVSSGLNMSTVSPEDAARLQLTTSTTKAHVAVLDTSTDAPTASILNLRLGAGILHNINVAQVNLISLLTHEPMPDAPTCWLGTTWLSDYQVTLDFDTHSSHFE